MGFTPNGKIYVLDFEGDSELDGLEVRCRSVPIGAMLAMGDMLEAATQSLDVDAPADETPAARQIRETRAATEQVRSMRPLLEAYASVLVSWNLELTPGVPTPATFDGLVQLDPAQVMRVITAWQRAVSDVPAPLPGPSSSGSPSPALSLPMEPLSPSLAS